MAKRSGNRIKVVQVFVFLSAGFIYCSSEITTNGLGESCTSSIGCPSNAQCGTVCGSQNFVCTCKESFINDRHGSCKKLVSLGGQCDAEREICAAGNASVVNGTCQCRPGFSKGPTGMDCVPSSQSLYFDDFCSSTSMCFYNMQCINHRCQCPPGHSVYDNLRCSPNPIGSSCLSNSNCLGVDNAFCSAGVCTCLDGFSQVQFENFDGTDATTSSQCVPSSQKLAASGNSCSETSPCESTQVCTICGDDSTYSKCTNTSSTSKNSPQTSSNSSVGRIMIGERCSNSSQCYSQNAVCKPTFSNCGFSVCNCIDGYRLDIDGRCKRGFQLGDQCDGEADLCLAENSACWEGRCVCNQGYKTGFYSDCVSTLKTERYNNRCYDSVQCYYNMICINLRCSCYTGYKLLSDNVTCLERLVGDSCIDDDDCSRTPNTICSDDYNVCSCQRGYKPVRYGIAANETRYACIPTSESQVGYGETCSNEVGLSGTKVCRLPYICTECSNHNAICV